MRHSVGYHGVTPQGSHMSSQYGQNLRDETMHEATQTPTLQEERDRNLRDS